MGLADVAFRIGWFGVGALAFWVAGRPIAALVLAGVFRDWNELIRPG